MNFPDLTYSNIINSSSRDFFLHIQNPILTNIMITITDLGNPMSVVMLCLVVLMFMWLHKKTEHMVQFIVAVIATSLLVLLTKDIVQLPRPTGGLITETGYSFISGHATMATVFFGLIVYSYKGHFKKGVARNAFIFLNVLFILVVGLSRVYLGVHYMTDVLAGFFAGSIITAISILSHQRHVLIQKKRIKNS
jgi:undecaprenyl-diphosphatase